MIENTSSSEEVELDELDIEEFAGRESARKPKAKKYVIRVDKTKYTVDRPEMTGREILILSAHQPPDGYRLRQKLHSGQMTTVELDAAVDFRGPGVERFSTIKLENTEG